MKRLILILLVILISHVAPAQGGPIPLFIKAKCDGKLPAVLLSSFKDALIVSKGYRLIATLDDDGRNNKVLLVQMACVERNSIVAVASAYGLAKCVGPKECHSAIDGSSMSALLCDINGEAQCGFELFKTLVSYVNTAKPILKVD